MNPVTLRARIEGAVNLALDDQWFSSDVFRRDIAVLAGNGLTRTAMALKWGTGYSWDDWLDNCLQSAGAEVTSAYLRNMNYNSAEIFEYALHRARPEEKAKSWETLWNRIKATEPSPLHEAVVALGVPILTTNYDDLFERAIASQGREPLVWALTAGSGSPGWSVYPEGANREPKDVYKLHGGFGRTHEMSFDEWMKGQPWISPEPTASGYEDGELGPRNTIAYRGQYEKVALAPGTDFEKYFGPVRSVLRGKAVILVGLGFTAEEITVSRLLREAKAKVIVLTVDPPLDPLWRYRRFVESRVIRIPLGLASSPASRVFAMLVGLRLILKRFNPAPGRPDLPVELEGIIEAFLTNHANSSPEAARGYARLDDRYPRIVSVGQASVNRVLGLENAVAQERAYSPTTNFALTWTPQGDRRFLTNLEVGGQSLVPCLVWDALRIPSALVAPLHADEFGRKVIERLQKTEMLDYEWVTLNQRDRTIKAVALQTLPSPGKEPPEPTDKLASLPDSVPVTENATIITWFGLRTILDSHRRFDTEPLRFSADYSVNGATPVHCFKLGAPIVYATKVAWRAIRDEFDTNLPEGYRPVVVYDTGGRGLAPAECWVAEREGIIVSSAYAALEWYKVASPVLVGGADIEQRAEGIVDAQNRWRASEAQREEPKDDRGRLWQIGSLIECVRKKPMPAFLELGAALHSLRAFVVTIGEMGSIYWYRGPKAWLKPRWVRAKADESLLTPIADAGDVEIDELLKRRLQHYSEVRSGLECGDVARAGLTASLLASMGDALNPHALTPEALEWGIGWANWFGQQKLKYFALDDYLHFVRGLNIPQSRLRYTEGLLPDDGEVNMGEGANLVRMAFGPLTSRRGLVKEARAWSKWFKRFMHPRTGRRAWEREIQAWQEAREVPERDRIRPDRAGMPSAGAGTSSTPPK